MRVGVIRLTSYAPLHLGQERWKRVIKSSWPFIPGATLYGAVAQILIRFTCTQKEATPVQCRKCLKQDDTPCNYHKLLKLVAQRSNGRPLIRFSPLVSSSGDGEGYDARRYSQEAGIIQSVLAVQPRAPLNRQRLAIHEERLHGVLAHPPFQQYRGFVCAPEQFFPILQKALPLLPLFPFGGGRGKFSQVEAMVEKITTPDTFLNNVAGKSLKLLTPALFHHHYKLANVGLTALDNYRLRRYRFWRTGIYFEDNDWRTYGLPEPQRAHATLTNAQLGLAEDTVIHLAEGNETHAQKLFLYGLGDADFTYLGWGQVYFKEQPT